MVSINVTRPAVGNIPAISTLPAGQSIYVRAARSLAEVAETAVSDAVTAGDRAISVMRSAGQAIYAADDVAIAADNRHSEASDDALWAAARLTEAREAVLSASDPTDVWFNVRHAARDEARWSGGTFTFDEAEARAEAARDEARTAQALALAAEREARATFDADAATLAAAAEANRAGQAAAEAATEHAAQAIAYARRIMSNLERAAIMADAACIALEACKSTTCRDEATEIAAEASHARNVLAEVAREVDILAIDVQ